MSYIPVNTGLIAAAANAAKKKKQKEEEAMANYNSNDLDGWEFKIVRANTRKFRSAEDVEKIRQEESKFGWELVEKFDDYRMRFKRRVEKRSMDKHVTDGTDPYRTQVGCSEGKIAGTIVGLVLLLALGVLASVFFVTGGFVEIEQPWSIIGIVGCAIIALGVIAIKKRS